MKSVLILAFAFFLVLHSVSVRADDGLPDVDYATVYTEDLTIRPKDGGTDHPFHVEIAATPDEMMRGLMFRQSMPEDHGMLFLFAQDAERNFWMKDTVIPLDIIFIRADGIIHHIHENAVPYDETPVSSNGPVRTVLELNGGTAARLGIKPGDTVLHASFGNSVAP